MFRRIQIILMGLALFASIPASFAARANPEGSKLATQIIEAQTGNWDASKLAPLMSSKSGVAPGELDKLFNIYNAVLGTVTSHTDPTIVDETPVQDDDFKNVEAYRTDIKCTKNEASVKIRLLHEANKYYGARISRHF